MILYATSQGYSLKYNKSFSLIPNSCGISVCHLSFYMNTATQESQIWGDKVIFHCKSVKLFWISK